MNTGEIARAYATALANLDKEECTAVALAAVQSGELDIVTFYEDVILPAMAGLSDVEVDARHQIWREHVMSAIVRSTIELSYLTVLQEQERQGPPKRGFAVVYVPEGEQHDLGARIVADYCTLAGFNALFLGANTPSEELIHLVDHLPLSLVVISVTNVYNLRGAYAAVSLVKQKHPQMPIVLGGMAFLKNAEQFAAFADVQIVADGRTLMATLGGIN
ncbi:MAG: cobalamin-dependent protein [Firmicutes bacterium]|nr:cobalamin-dependent protein [Dethiobacter sp.]MBS3888456.1 cobalamin-dependent protein [Bacillota bacterium]MBS4055068.1 cobalamin-dependent protein [Thermaerobacter sp.]